MAAPNAGVEHPPAADAAPTSIENRSTLLALRRDGQPYRFIDLAYRYLDGVDVDPEITVETLKTLVELELGGPARELLAHRQDLTLAGLSPAQLQQALAPIPTGRVDWKELAPTFEANLAVLLEAKPALAAHERDIRDARRRTQLFRDKNGRFHLSSRPVGGLRSWIPAFTDFAELQQLQIPTTDLSHAVAVLGFPLATLIEPLYDATGQGGPVRVPPIYLLDPSTERFAAWMHIGDHRGILGDDRVYFFVGADGATAFERFLESNDDLECPRLRLTCHVPVGLIRDFDGSVSRVLRRRDDACRRSVAVLGQRAAARRPADWAARLKPGAPVVGITSRHTTMLQYSMRDIGDALERAGFKFHLLKQTADHRDTNSLVLAKMIEELDPALVVLINHFRYEHPGPLASVPILTWVQDPTDIVLSRKTGESLGELDFACGYYYRRCTEEFGYPRSRFINTVIPVSSRTFHDCPVDPDDEARYACDIMYVGHLHNTVDEHCAKWRSHAAPEIRPLLDRIRDAVTAMHGRGDYLQYPGRLVEQAALERGVALEAPQAEHLAHFFASRLLDILFRRQTLEWVAGWAEQTGRRFRLYGRGWSDDPLFAKYALGPIEHGEPLRRAYRCAKLVLQSMLSSFMHQRTFEGLASGTLVLGRYAPPSFDNCSIEEFAAKNQAGQPGVCAATHCSGLERVTFREESAARHQAGQPRVCAATHFPGLERVTFRNKDEFERLCDHFLAEDDHRQRVLAEHRAIVHDRFTYTAIVPEIVDWIRTHLDAPDGGHHAGIAPSHEPSRGLNEA